MGYRKEIFSLQKRHLPLKIMKLINGILSYPGIFFLQLGQCERGQTTDSPKGILWMQTLRKLPTIEPKINAINLAIIIYPLLILSAWRIISIGGSFPVKCLKESAP